MAADCEESGIFFSFTRRNLGVENLFLILEVKQIIQPSGSEVKNFPQHYKMFERETVEAPQLKSNISLIWNLPTP